MLIAKNRCPLFRIALGSGFCGRIVDAENRVPWSGRHIHWTWLRGAEHCALHQFGTIFVLLRCNRAWESRDEKPLSVFLKHFMLIV
jgi:hypothetical protein